MGSDVMGMELGGGLRGEILPKWQDGPNLKPRNCHGRVDAPHEVDAQLLLVLPGLLAGAQPEEAVAEAQRQHARLVRGAVRLPQGLHLARGAAAQQLLRLLLRDSYSHPGTGACYGPPR